MTTDCGSDLFFCLPLLMVRWSRMKDWVNLIDMGPHISTRLLTRLQPLLRLRSQNYPPMLIFLVQVQYDCFVQYLFSLPNQSLPSGDAL